MNTPRAKHSAVTGPFMARPTGLASRSRRAKSRSETAALYAGLNQAYCRYTHDVPEAPFPTFLESLLFEGITADPPQSPR